RLEPQGATAVEQSGAAVVEPSDFPVAWGNPAEAELTWEWDDMHGPAALAPLAADYMATLAAGLNPGYEFFGSPIRVRYRTITGYSYFAGDWGVPDDQAAAEWDAIKDARRAFAAGNPRYWDDDCMPVLRRIYEEVSAIDVEGAGRGALAAAWHDAWASMVEVFVLHMIAATMS